MRNIKRYFKPNLIILFLFVVFVGFVMIYMDDQAEIIRKTESDYSEGWSVNGTTVDTDSIITHKYGGDVTISKELPGEIRYNDSLCFMSTNIYFDVFIGEEQVYSYKQPVNFTGYGYGTAYHAINLSPEQAGKTIRISMTGAFKIKTSGTIRMVSLENSQRYFSRLASGEVLSFIISGSIALLGILLLLFRLIVKRMNSSIDTIALGITAVIAGIWMAVDTGFLRLVADAVMLSRNLSYICMHLCFLPPVLFIYSLTKVKKKKFKVSAYVMSLLYYTMVLIARFVYDQDMASFKMIRCFFVYALLMMILAAVILITDRKNLMGHTTKHDVSFFLIGIVTVAFCALLDAILYMCGVRSISGYATFSRVGCFVFFLNMCIEVGRIWATEYSSLREVGYKDALTEVGNRRSYIEYEEEKKDIYPYGFVMCDVNALKKENDIYGHEAGDRLIKNVAGKLVEVFGIHNVFRVGGDEFVAYSFESTEERFNEKLEQARKMLADKKSSASIGGVYETDASADRNEIKKKAEKLMYAEKERYYSENNDRRR